MPKKRILDIVTPEGTPDSLATTFLMPVMLFPQDEHMRTELQEKMTARIFSSALYQWHKQNAQEDDQQATLIISRKLDSWMQKHTQPVIEPFSKQIWQGGIAGLILLRLMQIDGQAPPASVNKAMAAAEDYLQRVPSTDGSYGPRSLRGIQQAWSEYKPVVHLWAALLALLRREKSRSAFAVDALLSFFTESLPEFLAVAEYFLRFGADFHSRGQRKPLLTRSEVWHLPQGVSLPPFDITLPPLADQTIKILQEYCAPIRL